MKTLSCHAVVVVAMLLGAATAAALSAPKEPPSMPQVHLVIRQRPGTTLGDEIVGAYANLDTTLDVAKHLLGVQIETGLRDQVVKMVEAGWTYNSPVDWHRKVRDDLGGPADAAALAKFAEPPGRWSQDVRRQWDKTVRDRWTQLVGTPDIAVQILSPQGVMGVRVESKDVRLVFVAQPTPLGVELAVKDPKDAKMSTAGAETKRSPAAGK